MCGRWSKVHLGVYSRDRGVRDGAKVHLGVYRRVRARYTLGYLYKRGRNESDNELAIHMMIHKRGEVCEYSIG